MTRRFSISLPDDVAEVLDGVDNASSYVAEAIRMCHGRDDAAGFHAAKMAQTAEEIHAVVSARLAGLHLPDGR